MKSKHNVRICILITACLLVFYGCKPIIEFPIIPYIEFVSFTKIYKGTSKDDKGILTIYFTDGDGNIGFKENENDSSYNFFIDYYEKQEGQFVKIDLPATLYFLNCGLKPVPWHSLQLNLTFGESPNSRYPAPLHFGQAPLPSTKFIKKFFSLLHLIENRFSIRVKTSKAVATEEFLLPNNGF